MDQTPIREKDPAAEEAIRRWTELKTANNRPQWEIDAEDIARLIRPQRGGFQMDRPQDRDMEKPLNSQPILAGSSFAAGIYAGITNPATRWFGLETGDQDLNAWQPMREWNDRATQITLASFGPAVSSFYPATFQGYSDIAAFGNLAGYDEMLTAERRILDVTLSLAGVVVEVDAHGRVVEAVRKYHLNPRAAVREFRRAGDFLPAKIVEMAEKGKDERFTFYQHVKLNENFEKGRLGARGKRWVSNTAVEEKGALVRQSGYEEMPFYFARWDVDSGQVMGHGPGFIALASARLVNLMDAATIRAAQDAADPATLAPDKDVWPLNGRVAPGQTIYGGVDTRGNQLIRPFQRTSQVGLTVEEKREKLETVNNAFHYALMSLTGRTGVTDEETRIMEEARLRNWAPHADRIMEEYAARKVERRFRMLWRAGQLPPPPQGIPEGVPLRVRYQSAATAAMKAREGAEVRQLIADILPLAQIKPRLLDRLSEDDLIETLHDASPSLPAAILRSREEADQLAEARAQAAQREQMMQMGERGAGMLRDLGQAAGAGGGQ